MKKLLSISLLLLLCVAMQAQSPSVKVLFDKIPTLPTTCKDATLLCTYQETGYGQSLLVQSLFKDLEVMSPWAGESAKPTVKAVAGFETVAASANKMDDLMTQFKKEWDEKLNAIGLESRNAITAQLGDSKPATTEEFTARAKKMTPIQITVWEKNMPAVKAIYSKYYSLVSPLMADVDKVISTKSAQESPEMLNFRNDIRTRAVIAARTFLDKSSSISGTLANHAFRQNKSAN